MQKPTKTSNVATMSAVWENIMHVLFLFYKRRKERGSKDES